MRVTFVFPGLGAQYTGMGRELYDREPAFRAAFEACTAVLTPLGIDLEAVLFGPDAARCLRDTAMAQPALVAVEYALAQLWRAWGIEPAAVVGHDVGELAAAIVDGAVTLEGGLRLAVTGGGPRAAVAISSQKDRDALRLTVGLTAGGDESRQLLDTLARLYASGVDVDWVAYDAPYQRRRVDVPTYPFQRERFWFEETDAAPGMVATPVAVERYQIEWRPQAHAPELTTASGIVLKAEATGRWLILADARGVGDALAQRLQERGCECDVVRDEQIASARVTPSTRNIVHLWSLDAAAEGLDTAQLTNDQRRGCGSLLHLVQAVAAQSEGDDAPRVRVVTQGAQPAGPTTQPVAVAQAPVWGLGRVIALEHPRLWGGLIDLDPDADADTMADALLLELLGRSDEDQVCLRSGQRYVPRLVPTRSSASESRSIPLREDATYLVTGGLGVLGTKVAQWLAGRGAGHLVLVGRRPPSVSAQASIATLEETGTRVLVVQGDVAEESDVARALTENRRTRMASSARRHPCGGRDRAGTAPQPGLDEVCRNAGAEGAGRLEPPHAHIVAAARLLRAVFFCRVGVGRQPIRPLRGSESLSRRACAPSMRARPAGAERELRPVAGGGHSHGRGTPALRAHGDRDVARGPGVCRPRRPDARARGRSDGRGC